MVPGTSCCGFRQLMREFAAIARNVFLYSSSWYRTPPGLQFGGFIPIWLPAPVAANKAATVEVDLRKGDIRV